MNGKQFAIILSITFFVGMLWLVADIIFNTKPSIIINPKLEALLQPINPNFDPRVIKIIEDEITDTKTVQSTINNSLLDTGQPATNSASPR